MPSPNTTAIGLFSGGLDSILAALTIRRQGIRVVALQYVTPFFGWGNLRRAPELAAAARSELDIELRVLSLWPEYLEVVRNPAHGYGKHLNPCLDCKILLLRRAAQVMEEEGAAFVFTGEVVGQRPMSQRLDTLNLIERECGLAGRLVRPLTAGCLAPTVPETEGLVDRGGLHSFRGRTRRPQMELAASWGVRKYPAPAGGCLLTERLFASRMRGLLGRMTEPSSADIELLTVGRHFLLPGGARLVVGRQEIENGRLADLAPAGHLVLLTPDTPGPTAILSSDASKTGIELAARIVARYADHDHDHDHPAPVTVAVNGERRQVVPLPDVDLEPLRSI